MISTSVKGLRAALLLSVALMGAPAMAQETAGQINGVIAGKDGAPLANAQVRLVHTPTGAVQTTNTNAEGRFIGRGLALGGPYEVTVTPQSGAPEQIQEEVFLVLGEAYALNYMLGSRIEEITVSGQRIADAAPGVVSDFDRERIANAPTISRDLKDIIRGDSKVYIDRANLDAIQIAGTNNRFNLLTIDGVRNNDDFGLNNNGYPGTRGPLSIDVIDQLSVNVAPYSVTYSGFQGGNINIVTKGGTNDFSGSAYYYYSDDSLLGNNSGNRTVGPFTFKDKTYGATLGGPILEDKIFFFAGYEKFTTGNPVNRGPAGAGFTTSVNQVTQANYDQIKSIAQSVYGYDILGLPTTLEEADEKIFGKLNWNVNDEHRVVVSYTHNKGNFVTQTTPIVPSGTAVSVVANAQLSSGSGWYNNIQKVDSVSGQVFSDWTDAFKTELKVGYKKQSSQPTPLGARPFAEMQVVIPASANGTTTPGLLTFGPDRSRHFNSLTNELWTVKLKGDYLLGDHTITGGYEREMLDVFNAFTQDAFGTYFFNSIADFQARQASMLVYQNAISGNINDAAGLFKYNIDSGYIQDAWEVTPELTVTAGLRYERYSSDSVPTLNPNFVTRYGFANTASYDGRDLVLPRLSFKYDYSDDTVIRGGVGLFGGGSPNVWISNSYSNTGFVTGSTTITRPTTGPLSALQAAALNNVTGTVPAAVQASLIRGDGNVNALDPNFKMPSTWKASMGVDHNFDAWIFGNDWTAKADVIYSRVKNAVVWRENRLIQVGTAPDGRPVYGVRAGVPAASVVAPPLFNGVPLSAYPRQSSGNDLILSNTDEGRGWVASFGLANEWATDVGDIKLEMSYTWTDITDVNPGTSSTASSNWDNVATADINNPEESTSNYELKHNFAVATEWSKAFWGDYKTSVSLFGQARTGRPYSYTFSGNSRVFGDPRQGARQRQLFYVPKDATDVLFTGGLTYAQLDAYIVANGLDKYRGKIVPRNAFRSPAVATVDMRITQEIPGLFEDSKGVFSLDIRNLTNMINSSWGRDIQVAFPFVVPVVEALGVDPATGKYVYSGPLQTKNRTLTARTSVWQIQLGARYEF